MQNEPNYLSFGGPSASGEYMVNVGGYNHQSFIPMSVSLRIAALLGDEWDVCNRGTRIEIMSKKFFYGYRDDPKIVAAVTEVIGDVNREGDVGEVKFTLPMIQVIDEQASAAKNDVVFVKCAVIADTPDHWIVKPVEAPHFHPESLDQNQRFDHAHWRVAKSDTSAEPIADRFDVCVLNAYVAKQIGPRLAVMWRNSRKENRP
jgi:hypothetical protein